MPPVLCPFKYNGILFGHEKRKEILPFETTQMNMKDVIQYEIKQRKTNPVRVSFTCRLKKKVELVVRDNWRCHSFDYTDLC